VVICCAIAPAASTAKKQSPARQPGSFVCAEARNYFTDATLPNWASNGL
jgi:hypothetical protein